MQSDFRLGDSTANQLVDFVNEIQRPFDNKKIHSQIGVFGFTQGVWQSMARWVKFQIKPTGSDVNLLNLFSSYLQNRKQRVVLNGSCSEWEVIESGGSPRLRPSSSIILTLHKWSPNKIFLY